MRVAVIMSTYNGEKYLKEQIDSILNQKNVDVDLYIRDDGSTDKTIEILNEYSVNERVFVDYGENIGFRKSFICELVKTKGYKYYAFSDQDDYWEEEKLYAAVMELEKNKENNKVALYYSNLYIADEKLNICKKTSLDKRKMTLQSVIMRRSIAGCTMVINHALWQEVSEKQITDEMLLRGHDSFLVSLCYALDGIVYCDSNAYIRYRQHGNNTSGSTNGIFKRVKKEWNVMVNKKGIEAKISDSILNSWNEQIDREKVQILELIVRSKNSIISRLRIFLSTKYSTGNLVLTIVGKIKVLIGLL